jgi:hypothetical protein
MTMSLIRLAGTYFCCFQSIVLNVAMSRMLLSSHLDMVTFNVHCSELATNRFDNDGLPHRDAR